ncbi:hypothetical protein ACFWM0_25820 [Streptomyces sp. NPDC058405]|uniref:hypothetical protein n=2 Tax=unclassified Streptomyces TaxID=2593676 RepID=UPI0036549FB1
MNRTRRMLIPAVCAFVLLGAQGCTEDPKAGEGVEAADQCDGSLSPAAAEALEKITETKSFTPTTGGESVSEVAGRTAEEYERLGPVNKGSGLRDSYDLCLVYPRGIRDRADIRISFELADPADAEGDEIPPGWAGYPMGSKALASKRKSLLFFECDASRMKDGGGDPPMILGSLRKRSEAAGSGSEFMKANMTVLHSASLALAKELGCAANGDLPETPALESVA